MLQIESIVNEILSKKNSSPKEIVSEQVGTIDIDFMDEILSKAKQKLITDVAASADLMHKLRLLSLEQSSVVIDAASVEDSNKSKTILLKKFSKSDLEKIYVDFLLKKIKIKLVVPESIENAILENLEAEGNLERRRWLENVAHAAFRLKLRLRLHTELYKDFINKAEAVVLRNINNYYRRLLTGNQVVNAVVMGIAWHNDSYQLAVLNESGNMLYQTECSSLSAPDIESIVSEFNVNFIAWSYSYVDAAMRQIISKVIKSQKINQGLVRSCGIEYVMKDMTYSLAVILAKRLQQPLYNVALIPLENLGLPNFELVKDLIEPMLARSLTDYLADYKIDINTATEDLLLLLPGMQKVVVQQLLKYRDKNNGMDIEALPQITGVSSNKVKSLTSVLTNSVKDVVLKPPRVNMKSLCEGVVLPGTVSNLSTFGVFIDLGRGTSGLIHKSNLGSNFFLVGDKVWVKVISLDYVKKRINIGLAEINFDNNVVHSIKKSITKKTKHKAKPKSHFAAKLAEAVGLQVELEYLL